MYIMISDRSNEEIDIPTASITPVNTAGLSECISIFFSNSVILSKLIEFSTPMLRNIVENDAPL